MTEPLTRIVGRTGVLAADDVDTDQIIPARFLKGTTRDGLGRHLFADRRDAALVTGADRRDAALVTGADRRDAALVTGADRRDAALVTGADRRDAALVTGADRSDAPVGTGAEILVAGRNFGCGSSREHAVWALRDHGFRAVVALSFADIFHGNALKNGLVPVALPPEAHLRLVQSPGAEITIDVEALQVTLPGGGWAAFPLPHFARHCLLQGLDELTFLLSQEPLIADYERGGLDP